MSGPVPILYVFAISHYCEKARWALDYLGIDYELRYVAPGEHMQIARKLGAPRSYVPYLEVDGRVIQESAKIIDWADAAAPPTAKKLTPGNSADECRATEKRLDDVAGVHVRRYYYSEAIVRYPKTVRPIFTRDLPLYKRLLLTAAFGKIRGLMIKGMDLGDAQGQESRGIVEGELDWIDGLLSDGRRYLVGNEFSRADLTAASLLAPLAMPLEHPTYSGFQLPPGVAGDVAGWEQRPSIGWVREMYARHRRPKAPG